MLAIVVFVRFHDADAGESLIVERPVVTPAAKAVQAVDEHGVQVGNVTVGHVGDIACQLAGRAINRSRVFRSHLL